MRLRIQSSQLLSLIADSLQTEAGAVYQAELSRYRFPIWVNLNPIYSQMALSLAVLRDVRFFKNLGQLLKALCEFLERRWCGKSVGQFHV